MNAIKRTLVIMLILVGGFSLTPPGQLIIASGGDLYSKLRVFNDMIKIINDNYVDDVDWDKTMAGAQSGLVDALDPHSVYIGADRLDQINESFRGNFEGIGIEFDIIDDYITVITPIVGSPSDGLLLPGDRIVSIDGESAYRIDRDGVFDRLRGPKGTRVDLEVERPSANELIPVTIIRDEIPIYSVLAKFVMPDGTGYILINRFSATTSDEFSSAVNELQAQDMQRLIIDLRNNSGGYMDEVVKMVDSMVPGGEIIVSTKGRLKNANEEILSKNKAKFFDMPILVVINRGSASASEILAGAVQDLDRGLVVGETSFGKGLVQRQYPLRDGSALRVTVARYYTPSGRLIQRPYENGNSQDYYSELYDEDYGLIDSVDLATLPTYLTKQGRTVYGGGGITPDYELGVPGTISADLARVRREDFRFFFKIASDYATDHLELAEDWPDFLESFKFDDDFMNGVYDQMLALDIEVNADSLRADEDVVHTYLKSELAGKLWGRNEEYQIRIQIDNQIQESRSYFEEAGKIARNAGYF